MNPTSLSITRRGDLTFMVHGPTHCGSNPYTTPITVAGKASRLLAAKWTIEAHATPNSLDARGFLFDQAALDTLVHRVATRDSYDSCERLAIALGGAFCRGVAKENSACTLTLVRVTLSPTPYLSEISVTLTKE